MIKGPAAPCHRRSASDGTDINLVRFNMSAIEMLRDAKIRDLQPSGQIRDATLTHLSQTEEVSSGSRDLGCSNNSRITSGSQKDRHKSKRADPAQPPKQSAKSRRVAEPKYAKAGY